MQQVFNEIYQFAQANNEDAVKLTGLRKQDITECAEIVRQAFAQDKLDEREEMFKVGQKVLGGTYKDQKFFTS